MPDPIPLALIGIGKIACDRHLPAIAGEGRFRLVAAASHRGRVDGIANHPDIETLLAAEPQVAAVSIATPPLGRFRVAAAAIAAGKHVMLEKPPGATVGEVAALADLARDAGITLFASWHSREAPAVEPARAWLKGRKVRAVSVIWREDIRASHPGQNWILAPGGLGVFDPGINALSILTALLPFPLILKEATLGFPANRETPLTAELAFEPIGAATLAMSLDFLQTGSPCWDIAIETDGGRLLLSRGADEATVDGRPLACEPDREYPRLYARFAELIAAGKGDVDLAPLRIVADAFLIGRRQTIPAFKW